MAYGFLGWHLVDFTALKDRLGCFQQKYSDLDTASMIDVLMSAFGQFHIAGPLKHALGLVGLSLLN